MTQAQPALLIVEDDSGAARQLRWTFDDYDVTLAGDRHAALAALKGRSYPVILLDLGLPPDADGGQRGAGNPEGDRDVGAGLAGPSSSPDEGEQEHALAAIRFGAHDFYIKPIDADELRMLTRRKRGSVRTRRGEPKGAPVPRPNTNDCRESYPSATRCARSESLIGRAARTDIGVMLLGESGCGKRGAWRERSMR